MTVLSWAQVIEKPGELLEFGAAHVRCAWRRHTSPVTKFKSLESAFVSSKHSLALLLQEVGGNPNARRNVDRGEALFAAVWYPTESWAILGDATRITLVAREDIERFQVCKERDDRILEALRSLWDAAPTSLLRSFNASFYAQNIGR